MSALNSRALKIADILREVVANNLSAKDALKLWPEIDIETEKVIKEAWHNLYHYSVDTDIQAKDSKYKTYQENLIKEDIANIQELLTA